MKSILKLCTQVLGYISIYTFHFNPHWSQFGHTASLKNDKLTYSQNGTFNSKIIFDKKNRFRSLGIRIGTQTLWKLSLIKKFPNSLQYGYYVEKDTQKMPFLYIEGPKYVSFDNKKLNLEAFVHILITTIAISHFFAWEKRLL